MLKNDDQTVGIRTKQAREIFLGTSGSSILLTGEGVKIALFDSGLSDNHNLLNEKIYAGQVLRSHSHDNHALRGANLILGTMHNGAPLGLAPKAKIATINYTKHHWREYPNLLEDFYQRGGKIHISGHSYSFEEDEQMHTEGRSVFRNLTERKSNSGSLVFAAAGHDGRRRVRFPASVDTVISVGICAQSGADVAYSGSSDFLSKPDIFVPDYDYLTQNEDANLCTLKGTSAAVSISCGLASLVCEPLIRRYGDEIDSVLLRAAIFASTERRNDKRMWDLSHLLNESPYYCESLFSEKVEKKTLTFRIDHSLDCNKTMRFVVSPRFKRRSKYFSQKDPKVEIEFYLNGVSVSKIEGNLYALVEHNVSVGDEIKFEISVRGHDGFAIYGSNLPTVPLTNVDWSKTSKALSHKPLTVLGISASHNASACIIRDGKLERAVELERLSRIKRDGVGFLRSREAIDYCLDSLEISEKNVDVFAFNSQPLIPEYFGLSQPTHDESFQLFEPYSKRSLFVSHHLAHAFSAFFGSPFKKATVIVADGSGGSVIDGDDLILEGPKFKEYLEKRLGLDGDRPQHHVFSVYRFHENGFDLLDRELSASFNSRCGSSSLGETYASISQYIFDDWHASGKTMGLAPYGNPERVGNTFLEEGHDGLLRFSSTWKNLYRDTRCKKDPMLFKDLAARIQRDLEDALLQRFRKAVEKCGIRQVAYAGGIALNGVANARIGRELGLEDFFIFPASSDAGISVGAAAAATFHFNRSMERKPFICDYLGHPYQKKDIQESLSRYQDKVQVSQTAASEVAKTLADGQVIGIFDGPSEFGPRALGHRSIVADPRSKSTWEFINRRIKFREDFRPFAPAVPIELAHEYFEITRPSPYMLQVVRVKPKYQHLLGAVTHVDGSARVQTVDQEVSPFFHQLLIEFGKQSGIPILLNTSLNVRGQPIVETPSQAIEVTLATHLDGLWLNSNFIRPRNSIEITPTLEDIIVLAPGVQMVQKLVSNKVTTELIAEYQGKKHYKIPDWAFHLLAMVKSQKTVREVLAIFPGEAPHERDVLDWLQIIYKLKLVIPVLKPDLKKVEELSSNRAESFFNIAGEI